MPTWLSWALLGASAFAAGAINSVAGGGSLLTFPSLLAAGLTPLGANATSTVALVPGSASAFWQYRARVEGLDRATLAAVVVPSLVGGLVGARLVVFAGNDLFERLVPALILGATGLFAASEPLGRWARGRAGGSAGLGALAVLQLAISVYGGFFGAGIGILMLAGFALAGETDVHRANALKTLAAVAINSVAAIYFAISGNVRWPEALWMAVGAIAGGRYGARLALRFGPKVVRGTVIAVGLGIGVWQLLR
jgi:uncharacterized membrane protein YfcA